MDIGGHAPEAGGNVWVLEDNLDDVGRGRDGARGSFAQRDGDGILVGESAEDVAEEIELREVVVNEGIFGWKLANSRGATCERQKLDFQCVIQKKCVEGAPLFKCDLYRGENTNSSVSSTTHPPSGRAGGCSAQSALKMLAGS